jgi:hypothetical protein
MSRKEQIIGIFNGIYKMLKENDYEVIMDIVSELDKKINDPLLKAVLNYEPLTNEDTIKILMVVFSIFKPYYGTMEDDDAMWSSLVQQGNDCVAKITECIPEGNAYTRRLITVLIEEIEAKYKEGV